MITLTYSQQFHMWIAPRKISPGYWNGLVEYYPPNIYSKLASSCIFEAFWRKSYQHENSMNFDMKSDRKLCCSAQEEVEGVWSRAFSTTVSLDILQYAAQML
jgi:hypothetical protein